MRPNEPRVVASGPGWRVFRVGRSSCIQFDRTDRDPLDIWLAGRSTDMARHSLLCALVAGAHGAVDQATAIAAMQADW